MKILIVNDVDGWAFENRAINVKKYLTDLQIDYMNQMNFLKKYRNKTIPYNNVLLQNWLVPNTIDCSKFLTLIASHRLENNLYGRANKILPNYKAIGAVSRRLEKILKTRFINQKVFEIENGVDENLFTPFEKSEDKFVIGFSSKKTGGKEDIKGYESVLLPLKERMSKYPDIEFLIHDNNHRTAIPQIEMPNIYKKMDLFIVTSKSEGTPNGAMEAASCGIPVIGFDVGVLCDLLEPKCLICPLNSLGDVPDRLEIFEKMILELKNNKEEMKRMGKRNREEILNNWTWKMKAEKFREFLTYQPVDKIEKWNGNIK